MPAARRTWTLGDRLTHRHNPEMGVGLVVEVQERAVVVEFPGGVRLRLAEASDALVPVAAVAVIGALVASTTFLIGKGVGAGVG